MSNPVLKGLAFNDEVRFMIVDSTELVNTIHKNLITSPVASAAIGRSASITGLMGLMLKGDETVSTMVKGDGPIGQIITVADANGKVRATCSNPHIDIPLKDNQKLDVSGAVGNGVLKVVKDLKLKEPFNSEIDLISGEIAEDYTYYFSVSEQIPTAISAGVLVDIDYTIKSAGALIIQLMPNASEETIDKLENLVMNLVPISTLLEKYSLVEIIEGLFEKNYNILEENKIYFECNCNEEKFINGMSLLNKEEILEIKKEKTVECVCTFCNKKYQIDTEKI